ncbi:MAG: DUF4912 domain-containing protein [Candidatus Firestonebacteria bacterium]
MKKKESFRNKENLGRKGFVNTPRIKKAKKVGKVNPTPSGVLVKEVEKAGVKKEKVASQFIWDGVNKEKKIIEVEKEEIPERYNETKIVIMSRDPYWIYAYWDVASSDIELMRKKTGSDFNNSKSILRVYDVTNIKFNGKNAHKSFDLVLSGLANNWYINVGEPERSWCVELGILTPSGKFFVYARSNVITTPSDKVSNVYDEEWMVSEEELYRRYLRGELKGGVGSEFISKIISRRLREEISSGMVSSLSSGFKEFKLPSVFWLTVGTELIIYGATEPDSVVLINKTPVKLVKDGTFSLRFALTDGKHIINIEARSKDGKHKKSARITVEQNIV